jgi:hypothetical protein
MSSRPELAFYMVPLAWAPVLTTSKPPFTVVPGVIRNEAKNTSWINLPIEQEISLVERRG